MKNVVVKGFVNKFCKNRGRDKTTQDKTGPGQGQGQGQDQEKDQDQAEQLLLRDNDENYFRNRKDH